MRYVTSAEEGAIAEACSRFREGLVLAVDSTGREGLLSIVQSGHFFGSQKLRCQLPRAMDIQMFLRGRFMVE